MNSIWSHDSWNAIRMVFVADRRANAYNKSSWLQYTNTIIIIESTLWKYSVEVRCYTKAKILATGWTIKSNTKYNKNEQLDSVLAILSTSYDTKNDCESQFHLRNA